MSGVLFDAKSAGAREIGVISVLTAVAVYTVPLEQAEGKAIKLHLANVDAANAVSVKVEIYVKTVNLAYTYKPTQNIVASGEMDVEFDGLPLEPEDEIRVTAGSINDIHYFVHSSIIPAR